MKRELSARATLAIAALVFSGCGSTLRLPHHTESGRTAPVELAVNERVLALAAPTLGARERINLASEDPAVVDVAYSRMSARSSRVYLVGRSRGSTTVHYGRLAEQVAPFAGSESTRVGSELPGLSVGTAITSDQRVRWLRDHSLGSFQVIVR